MLGKEFGSGFTSLHAAQACASASRKRRATLTADVHRALLLKVRRVSCQQSKASQADSLGQHFLIQRKEFCEDLLHLHLRKRAEWFVFFQKILLPLC